MVSFQRSFTMSAPKYNMASSWTDSYVPPQLEQEYPLDTSLYASLTGDSSTSYGRRQQQSADHQHSNGGASLSGFDSTFPPSMNDFTFTARQPATQPQGMTNGMFLTTDTQMQRQYSQQGSIFSSPPSATIQDPLSVGTSLTPGYGSYQVQGMRSGPSTPAPGGFSAPGSDNGYAFGGGYSPGQLSTNGIQPSIFDTGSQSGSYGGQAFKRMRPADTDQGVYDLDGDAEAEEGGAPNGDTPKKPYVTAVRNRAASDCRIVSLHRLGACSRCKGLKV